MNIHLILYDITDDRIRTKIAKRLIAEGFDRLQLSVMIGNSDPLKITGLWPLLQQRLKPEPNAKFYTLQLLPNQVKKMSIIGEINIDIDFLLGTKSSIFI